MPQTLPTAEPFFFPGNRTGILLLHGYTSAPKEMRWMGENLNRRGYTACGIRLAGHATQPEDMLRVRWQDWLLSVEDGYQLLRACTEEIFLAGLSMGGMLALITASRFPVRGVIAMSTPYSHPKDWRLKYTKPLSRFKPFLPKIGGPGAGTGWFGEAWREHVAYPEYPVRSLAEVGQLMDELHASLPKVKAPVLLIQSQDDHPLFIESMAKIHARLGSANKEMLWIKDSGHTMTEEPQREVIFQAAADFIMKASQAGL
jgi:carboxylesterase